MAAATTGQTEFTSSLWLSQEELAARGIPEGERNAARSYFYQQAYGVNMWYEQVKTHTFATEFVHLSFEEVMAVFSSCKVNAHAEQNKPKEMSDEIEGRLKEVDRRLDEVISKFPNGVFVKLNTRSPKDVHMDRSDEPEFVKEMMEKVKAKAKAKVAERGIDTKEMREDILLCEFVRATLELMRVTSGKEALGLLCQSRRIYQDLGKVTNFGTKDVDVSITVREWLDEVPKNSHMEFRGFVYKNSLNAVTQYDDISMHPEIVSNKEALGKRILDFFNSEIKESLKSHENYVVDFLVTPEKIYLIELNPFHIGAGPGLFKWRDHRELFMHGPYEFRIVEKDHESPLSVLPVPWEKALHAVLAEFRGTSSNTHTHDNQSGGGLFSKLKSLVGMSSK
eukprot:Colp12_sorted_trinity150504_noHs@24896